MSKRRPALGSSPLLPLDATGIDTTDHPVDKLLHGKITSHPRDNAIMALDEVAVEGVRLGAIIAWKCALCGCIWETLDRVSMGPPTLP
jgi:hypothetical protein